MTNTFPNWSVMVAAAALSCTAACTGGESRPTEPPAQTATASPAAAPRASAGGSQVALHTKPVDGYMDSVLAGTLAVVDGCVVIRTTTGPVTPVFVPGDVDWDGATLTFLATGRELRLGTEVRLSGGRSSGVGEILPPGCPDAAWAAGPS